MKSECEAVGWRERELERGARVLAEYSSESDIALLEELSRERSGGAQQELGRAHTRN